MKKELLGPKVENVGLAIAQEKNNLGEKAYYVYLINLREDIMEGIIVCSKGYGEDPNLGEPIKTSMIRHSLEVLLPNEAAKIEPIMEAVFSLYNELSEFLPLTPNGHSNPYFDKNSLPSIFFIFNFFPEESIAI